MLLKLRIRKLRNLGCRYRIGRDPGACRQNIPPPTKGSLESGHRKIASISSCIVTVLQFGSGWTRKSVDKRHHSARIGSEEGSSHQPHAEGFVPNTVQL